MTDCRARIAALLEGMGGHPAAALGLDLGKPEDVSRWFVAACLLAGRAGEERALEAFRALERAGCARIDRLSAGDSARIQSALEGAGYRQPEAMAGLLVRAAAGLDRARGVSLEALAADADGLEDLGERLARTASGLGVGTILRFLRPLRRHWLCAREVPLTAAARAAAVHLGLLREVEDVAGEPGALQAALRDLDDPVELADLEAALERLGARACQRNRPERCPLADGCPARSERARSAD